MLTTAPPDEANGSRGARRWRLAACVNTLGSVSSTYRWQGAVQQEQESLPVIKTTEVLRPSRRFASSSYECPRCRDSGANWLGRHSIGSRGRDRR